MAVHWGIGLGRFVAGACLALALATPALTQEESTNRVAAKTDWSVFVESDPEKQCWGVSAPKESINTRDGRVVAVRRGDILLMVHYLPSQDVKGQVTFTGGYPFAEGSTVNLQIGSNSFELFVGGAGNEWAWPASVADDAKIITAMKRGAQAVLTARSRRGTQTVDTFSLLGFTAAIEDAEGRCSD